MGLAVPYGLSIPKMVLLVSNVLALLPPVSAITPLNVDQFCRELSHQPNPQLVSSALEGIRHGFKLGFSHLQPLRSAKRNKPSEYEHPTVINEYLANEVSLVRVADPFASLPFPFLHVSSYGVIPKKGQPGKCPLIVDLSSPWGASVNDGINPDEFALRYITGVAMDSSLSWPEVLRPPANL